jgi:hypothetical protein
MVAFTSYTSVTEAAQAVQDFLIDHPTGMPDDVREQLRAMVGPMVSPVDTVVRGAELLYARSADIGAPAKRLAAALALVAHQYNFHGMAEDSRGSKIALGLMRDSNVDKPAGVEYPEKDKDPEPKPEYRPNVDEAPAEAEVPARASRVTVQSLDADMPKAEGSRRGRGRRQRNATNTS